MTSMILLLLPSLGQHLNL